MNKKNKLWAIIGVSVVVVALVAVALIGRFAPAADPHAGHDHDADPHTSTTDGHGHEGEGDTQPTGSHSHGSTKIKYEPKENGDGTYSFTLKDPNGKLLFSKDGLDRYPLVENVSEDVYRLGWPTGSGPNDFQEVYCHRKSGQVSEVFDGAVASDGVRIALPIGDSQKGYSILVRNVFDNDYTKEHKLEDAFKGGKYAVLSGKMAKDKTVRIIYLAGSDGTHKNILIDLYAK